MIRKMASDMPTFDKDDYLNGMPDAESLKSDPASAGNAERNEDSKPATDDSEQTRNTDKVESDTVKEKEASDSSQTSRDDDLNHSDKVKADEDTLTPLGQAKKEAAEYLDALQRERAQFVNYRNRTAKEQETFRQHGIIDVLTALLPALDDIDRIREHDSLDDSFAAVAAKIDKTFEKFGVEKFGAKGEEFDPTKHEAVLHKPDSDATKETVDTVVEAGYKIGDRVIRAARVVVSSPQN